MQVLNFDSPRGGISLETEKTRTGTTSKLLVTRATVRDNGNYTCMPSRGDAVSADVHVITGSGLDNFACVQKLLFSPRNPQVQQSQVSRC